MKMIINENQRGMLYKNGNFLKMLMPGKYTIFPRLGQQIRLMAATGQINASPAEIASYLKDRAFAEETIGLEVPDDQIAIWFLDGRLSGCLQAGSYRFWNIFQKNSFEMLNISQLDTTGIPRQYFEQIPSKLFLKLEVNQGERGLLMVDGEIVRSLKGGTYYFWNALRNVTAKKYDLRVTPMEVSGQEILTADKVSLRLNFLCSYRITDPAGMETTLENPLLQLYSTVQLVLREYVGRFRLDELLEQKNEIAAFVLEKLRGEQARLYVEFVDAGLKDIILPGEIRDIMNTVLVAEKKAQANVIARREEVASTRSLLNTAKLLDENATLARLKELESLERLFDKVGYISVSNADGLLNQLKGIAGVSR